MAIKGVASLGDAIGFDAVLRRECDDQLLLATDVIENARKEIGRAASSAQRRKLDAE